MSTSKYYFANFRNKSMKCALADWSRHVIKKIDEIFEVFQKYTDKSYGESPRRIMHYMTQNNKPIFGTRVPSGSPRASTSSEEQLSHELTSPVRRESSSKSLQRKQLPLDAEATNSSEPVNVKTDINVTEIQESVESLEESQPFDSSEENVKIDIAATNDGKMESNPDVERNVSEGSEMDVKALMSRNLVRIKSMSIIRQRGEILGVEIDIDESNRSNESLPKSFEQDSSVLEETPSKSPLTHVQSTGGMDDSEPLLNVSDLDPNTLGFLATRLFSIFSYRKLYMNQIHDSFEKFQSDVQHFYSTIGNVKCVLELLNIETDKHFTADQVNMYNDLKEKAREMLKHVKPVLEEAEQEVGVWKKCIKKIEEYDDKYGQALSTKDKRVLNSHALKRLEEILQDICKEADCTVILKEGRREILLKSKSDFEWLVKNFIQFLIITEILVPKKDVTEE